MKKKLNSYYVYGFLHHPGYRSRFANDLKKTLPRLPLVDEAKDFWAFSKAGRALAELHLNYESLPFPAGVLVNGAEVADKSGGDLKSPPDSAPGHFRVEKMRFPKKGEKDSILFNSQITISNIPAEAYEYTVNGKSAIEWVMERYRVSKDKDSGIRNDPNDWEGGRYVLELVLRVIYLNVETVGVVRELPEIKLE